MIYFPKLSANLCHLSGSADEQPVIGAHPAVHHTNVSSDLQNIHMNGCGV